MRSNARLRGLLAVAPLAVAPLAVALLAACAEPAPEPETPQEPRPPVEARSKVDRAVATTGDVITYTVTVDYDPAYEVDLPEPGAEIAGFRIIDIGREEPRDERGRRIEERWYKLRADLVGSYILPPVTVTYRPVQESPEEDTSDTSDVSDKSDVSDNSGVTDETLQTSEIFIEVQSVLPGDGEATDIRDVKPLRQIERPTPWWWYAAGGGAVVLLLVVAFLLWRRGRKAVEVPPRPAHEVAFEALDRLRGTDFEDPEAVRLFHFDISEVIRTYVENRFTLNATDLTTEEIVDHLDEVRGLDRENRESLRTFLDATDQVKFAAYLPSEEEIGATYERGLSFVEATRQRPEEAAGDTEAGSGGASGETDAPESSDDENRSGEAIVPFGGSRGGDIAA